MKFVRTLKIKIRKSQNTILELQEENKVNITGHEHHGVKSTAQQGILLQSIIANHTNIGEHVLRSQWGIPHCKCTTPLEEARNPGAARLCA